MKIYTKVVWQWVGDNLVRIEEESFDYNGPIELAKGGGGAAETPQELKDLYKFQEEQGRYLFGQFKDYVAPAYQSWLGEAKDYGSQANQEQQASRAMADAGAAGDINREATMQELKSMGIDPSDTRYANTFKTMGIQNAGIQAASATGARENVRNKGFAMQQDAIGMGMGTPTQATQAANSASNTANSMWQGQLAQQQQQANSVGALARLGTNMMGWTGGAPGGVQFEGADGGLVRLQGGGLVRKPVQRLAGGGMAGGGGGFLAGTQISAPPPMAGGGAPRSSLGAAAQGVGSGMVGPMGSGVTKGLGYGIEKIGSMAGSPGMTSFGTGMRLGPKGVEGAKAAYDAAAASQVDKTLGLASQQVGTEAQLAAANEAALTGTHTAATEAVALEATAAEAAAAEAAAAAAAETAAIEGGALALGEAGAGLGAGAALGAAVPWIGAGLAAYGIGSEMGWWADGGRVTPYAHGARGGEVDGPGGPKDDEVPAMLSDGEFVMPIGAVKFFGLDRLEKMRQKGLEYEKQLGIHRADGGSVDSEDVDVMRYRASENYFGYEDPTPSGRVALDTYIANEKPAILDSYNPHNIPKPGRMNNTRTLLDRNAVNKAQAAQREYNDELRRETRGKVPRSKL